MASIFPRRGLVAALAALALAAGCSDTEKLAGAAPGTGGTGAIGGDGGTGGDGGMGGGGAGGTGGDGGTGGTGGPPPEGCVEVELGANLVGMMGGPVFHLTSEATPGIEGAHDTLAAFELYNWNAVSGEPMPLELGNFDLTAAPNDDYATCQHCVVLVAFGRDGWPTRIFFQKSGEVEITKLPGEEDGPVAAGRLTDVKLLEIREKPDFSWEDVPDSDCFWIRDWSFDTTPNNGAPCERVEDCANTGLQSCDPDTGRCVDHQCSFTGDVFCDNGEICVPQNPYDNSWGACYDECTPFVAGQCAQDEICVPLGPTQSTGACKKVGDGKLGESCDEPDLSTGCEWGAICMGEPAVCTKICPYLTADPGCPEGQVCGIDNICADPAIGDPAAPGEACDPTSPMEMPCGADGDAFAGLCLSLFPDVPELTCMELCRMDDPNACADGSYCAPLFANPELGICWEEPVCGDGVLDPVNEICDDGNTDAGDGCSADCDTAEFGPLCDDAADLLLDQTISGTTEGGPTGYVGMCRMYPWVPASTYRFTPPGPGTLSVSVTSTVANMDLIALRECADPGTELACSTIGEETEYLDIDFDEAATTPSMIVVAGRGMKDVGAFELQAHWTEAICGDGTVAGPERCDDGNTDSGDGCTGDCTALEWPQICEGLPELSTDILNDGDTTGATDYQRGSGICAAWAGDGPEDMYSFTAPANGILHLRLDSATTDHVLYVVDGCFGVEEWEQLLGCSNSGRPGPWNYEERQVTLTQGQEITVVVEGFLSREEGPYSLEALFVAQ